VVLISAYAMKTPQQSHLPVFEQLGLSPSEAKIYDTLLIGAEMGATEIATIAKVHRRNVYDAINRLHEKGLVFQIFQKGENLYRAVHPHKLLELVREREERVNEILPSLTASYEAEPLKEAAFIYKGVEGFKNYMRDLVRVGEDTYFLGAKALWFSPGVSRSYLNDFVRMSKEKGLKYKTLYDPRVPEKFPQAFKDVGGEYKVLPKGYETVGVVDVFGDHVVTFTSVDVANFGEDGSIFVMINRELAESYRQWFRFMWDNCPTTKNGSLLKK